MFNETIWKEIGSSKPGRIPVHNIFTNISNIEYAKQYIMKGQAFSFDHIFFWFDIINHIIKYKKKSI